MTTQTTEPFVAATGLTLTAKVFTLAAPDTEVTGMTGGTVAVTEYTNAKGSYVPQIFRATALPAGDYRIGLFLGSTPHVWGYRTFVGTDGEVAVKTPEVAVLNAATRVKLAADQPDYAPATATALTAALTKIRKFFQLSLRKDVAISTDNAAELAEINANGGTGVGGYLSTTDSQEAIRDAISNLISTSVVVPGPVLTAVGMPETLEIGDSYEEESCLTIYIRDADDNPVSAAVGHDFTDGDFAPTFVIAPAPGSSRGRVKGIVTYVDPGGSDEPYLKVDIPSSQSKLAVAGEASVQLVLKWPGAEKTLLNTTVRWLPRI